MLNFRSRTKAGKPLEKVVEFQGESPAELLRLLVAEGRTMAFSGRPDPPRRAAQDSQGLLPTEPDMEDQGEPSLPPAVSAGDPVDPADNKLSTQEYVTPLQRKLTKIHRDAKLSLEEQGVNVLYLVLGMLEWYEDDSSQEKRLAPLILVPVTLERTPQGRFRLKWDESELGENLSIAAKVRADFGLKLPSLGDDPSPGTFFDAVAAAVKDRPRWRVDRDAVALGFLSYAKFLMYKDLDAGGWPDGRKPGENSTMGSLLDCGFPEAEDAVSEEAFLDPLRTPGETFEVYDADGSQTLAILEALSGRTMLIEGPPGTGKSQTITNIIAELIGRGKKVLFVAEKAAALNVVHRRLGEAELGDACLELHSNKTNRRSFYTELKRTVMQAAPARARVEQELRRLREAREVLNDYAQAANEPVAVHSISPRYAMGHLLRLSTEDDPTGRHTFEPMSGWSQAEFEARYELVSRLQAHIGRTGAPQNNPFWGCNLNHMLPSDREDLVRLFRAALQRVDAFADAASKLAGAITVERPARPEDLDKLAGYVDRIAAAPRLDGISVLRPDWPEAAERLSRIVDGARRLREFLAELNPILAAGSFERDPSPTLEFLRLAPVFGTEPGHAPLNPQDLTAFEASQGAAEALLETSLALTGSLGVPAPESTHGMEPLAALASWLAEAPNLTGFAVSDPAWPSAAAEVRSAIAAVQRLQEIRAAWSASLHPDAFSQEITEPLAILERRGASFLGRLHPEFRRAFARAGELFATPPKDVQKRIAALVAVRSAQEALSTVQRSSILCRRLIGERWQAEASAPVALRECAEWVIVFHDAVAAGRVPPLVLTLFDRGGTDGLRELSAQLRQRLQAFRTASGNVRAVRPSAITGTPGVPADRAEEFYRFHLRVAAPMLAELRAFFSQRLGLVGARKSLEQLSAARNLRAELDSGRDVLISWFGTHWRAEHSDTDYLGTVIRWAADLHNKIRAGEVPPGVLQFLASGSSRDALPPALDHARQTRSAAVESIREVLRFLQHSADAQTFTAGPIAQQRDQIALWLDRIGEIQTVITLNSLLAEAAAAGLQETVRLATSWPGCAHGLSDSFARAWYNGVVRKAITTRPVLARFDRRQHETVAESFRALDDTLIQINRRTAQLEHWRAVPRESARGALGWLQAQMELRRNHRPIRTAMREAHEAIQAIKPVFMMSPLSVAMYLPADGPQFDVVIFDEASQVKPADAFGGLLRAKQGVVVGDSKQMPPTSFFDRLTEADDDDDEEVDEVAAVAREMESVLALVSSKLPPVSSRRRDLRWHYRSRHDSLIATSNRLFYGDRLVVFPNPWRSGAGRALILHHDPSTVYLRGNKRTNPKEAHAVALAVRRHILNTPNLTLGVVAFSKAQAEAIQDEIDLLQKEDPAFAAFDSQHVHEPLIVRNLENIQGDERDVIFISVGYGRDENGHRTNHFGPVNRDGGERRLNVLISRARIRCEVFSNIRGGDVSLPDPPAPGVAALKTFLTFADTGSLDVPSATGLDPQSPFEEEVLERLRAVGYDVEPQVGSCGFYIDMAVRHPADPGRFVLGIECDGAMYHCWRAARDRDKLRQQVLENRGWKLHRIWSTDWFSDPERELRRTVEAIQAALATTDLENHDIPPSASPSVFLEFEELETEETTPEAGFASDYTLYEGELPRGARGSDLDQLPAAPMGEWIAEIVKVEAPVHCDIVLRRIRERVGVNRAGNRIRDAFERGIRYALATSAVALKGEFLYRVGQTEWLVRSRRDFPAAVKKLEYVADEEIDEAIVSEVVRSYRLYRDEVGLSVARLLGFDRVSSQMLDRLNSRVDALIAAERLTINGSALAVPGNADRPI